MSHGNFDRLATDGLIYFTANKVSRVAKIYKNVLIYSKLTNTV